MSNSKNIAHLARCQQRYQQRYQQRCLRSWLGRPNRQSRLAWQGVLEQLLAQDINIAGAVVGGFSTICC